MAQKPLFLLFPALLLCLLISLTARADTYDTHTLVAITTSGPEEVKILYDCRVDIVGRKGDVYKALLTEDQLKDMIGKGFKIEILYAEMGQDRAALATPGWCTNTASPCYWYPAKFNTTNPPVGTIMKHLLDLYTAHPTITRLYNLGASQDGAYDIIAMKVTKNPDTVEAEPKMRIYANIHGDEVCGLMVACDVLDWILANYATDATAQKLVDESEMWFIPMGNPYGNATQQRYNSNNVDLNRNFWGPAGSDEPPAWSEKETQVIRDLTETATADHSKKRFATSITFHGGEVCFNSVYNYTSAATSDEPIFFSSRTGGPNGGATPALGGLAQAYFDGCTTPGFWYTNGADWYVTLGDTNDWSYGMWGDLDTTVEIHATKWPDSTTIPTYTAQHRQGVLNYMLKTFQGIHGVMTDQGTGAPLDGTVLTTATASATIPVPHAYQAIYTDPVAGDFHRVLQPGTYTVTCKATGYPDTVVTGVVVTADTKTICNCPMTVSPSLHYSTSAVTDSCSGGGGYSGDGILDAGEDATLLIALNNTGSAAATGVQATISTGALGITITQGTASFANISAGGSGASVSPHFKFSVGTGVACGTILTFTLHMTSAQGAWDDSFTVTVGQQANGTPTTVFAESYDGTTFPPAGWTVTDVNGASGNWTRMTTSAYPTGITPHTGAGMAAFNSYTATSGNSTRLARTANINIPAGIATASAVLWVYHETAYTTSPDRIQIQTSPDGTTWTDRGTAVNRNDGSTGWKQHNIDLSALIGAGNFRIGYFGVSAYGNDTHLDDVSVAYTPPGVCTMHACTPSAVPGETAPGGTPATAQSWTGKTTQGWPSASLATSYMLYRGVPADLPKLLNSQADSCTKYSGSGTSATINDDPAGVAGRFYWYLVTGANGNGEGTAGNATNGARIVNSSGVCP